MSKKTVSTKVFVLLLAAVLLLGCTIGGTVAFLMYKTDPVINTFSPSNIQIELTESEGTPYKLIPGKTYTKDPVVSVLDTTDVDCYLFVKIEEKNWTKFQQYVPNTDGWTNLTGGDDTILYRIVHTTDTVKSWNLLLGDNTEYPNGYVTISPDLTLTEMAEAAKAELIFTAYAIQLEGFATAEAAWEEVSKLG